MHAALPRRRSARPAFPAITRLTRRLIAVSALLVTAVVADAQASTWSSVRIGGGGYVTGLTAHPQNVNLLYIRTDVGGAYRWDAPNSRWLPLCDSFSSGDHFRVDAMNVDPSDAGQTKVYIATASASRPNVAPATVWRSSNQGSTWTDTGIPAGATLNGNGDYRWAGDRLVIDPNKPGRAFLGSRSGGLWLCSNIDTSTTGSSNWSSVAGVPAGSTNIGVTFVAFHKTGGVNGSGFTNILYVGVWGSGVYRSTNAGSTWTFMSGSPAQPLRGIVNPSGHLWVTHTSGVARWNTSSWNNNIGPNTQQFAGIDIHPADANKIIVAQRISGDSNVFLSTDGGTSWTMKNGTNTNTVGWQPTNWFADAVSCIRFAPSTSNPNKVWFTDWYNIWKSNDAAATTPAWQNFEVGHEELVMMSLRAPSPTGTAAALLWSGAADIGGLRHNSLTAFPAAGDKLTGFDVQSIDVFEGNNNIVYYVAGKPDTTTGNGYRSADGGATWTAFDPGSDPVLPDNARSGRIAVSALSSNLILWVPRDNQPFYSTDGGVNWNTTSGTSLPANMVDGWEPSHFLASNKTTTNRFYIYKPNVGFYRSNTGSTAGSTWTLVSGSGLPSTSTFTRYGIKTVPGQNGGVWANVGHNTTSSSTGVWKSTNSGTSFTKLGNVLSAEHIAFGLKATGSSHPATAFMFGKVTGDTQNWIYRSDDMGASWTRINTTALQFANGVKALEGDRKVYGRVYVATSGRSIYVGVP